MTRTIRPATTPAPASTPTRFVDSCGAGHTYIAYGRPDAEVYAAWRRAHQGHEDRPTEDHE